jgi:spore coat polysaccharide biosynthesis protein SpsF (cytidylyltransferase family)
MDRSEWTDEQERANAEAIEQQRREAATAELERQKEEYRQGWLEAGSTEAEFERAWPDIRRELLNDAAAEAARTREEHARQQFLSVWRS